MKKIFASLFVTSFLFSNVHAQGLSGLLNKAKAAVSSGSGSSSTSNSTLGGGLSNGDIVSGLKQALQVGTDSTVKKLGATDGFFGNAAIKILMPPETQKIESTLRSAGMGSLVDKAILSMNRAAEDASKNVGPIFWTAITNMSITDGLNILRGSDTAATAYLRQNTTAPLTVKCRPVIDSSMSKYHVSEYWNKVFTAYNQLPFASKKVNTDIVGYVTDKALSGLFYNIGLEEIDIRKNPAAQVTSLLQKVFGGK